MANSNTYIRDGFVSAGSAQITGSLGVTGGITGSLQGTASYATQALSASYAPGGATFPYNGNAVITGSLNVTAGITGSLLGTASVATLAGTATIANTVAKTYNATPMTFIQSNYGGNPTYLWGTYDVNSIYLFDPSNFSVASAATASYINPTFISASAAAAGFGSGGGASVSASYAATASYVLQAISASYAPSAGGVAFPFTGSAIITGSLNVIGNTAITGSLVAGYNPTPLEGTIQDGVTSVLGNLNDWDSAYYQGTVLYKETAGGTIGNGQLCYRNRYGNWVLADATVVSEESTHMLGICVRHQVSGSATSILINGFIETTHATTTKSGEPLYMDTTPGSMTYDPPTSVGNAVRLIGNTFWVSNTNAKIIIHFNPENSWIEL